MSTGGSWEAQHAPSPLPPTWKCASCVSGRRTAASTASPAGSRAPRARATAWRGCGGRHSVLGSGRARWQREGAEAHMGTHAGRPACAPRRGCSAARLPGDKAPGTRGSSTCSARRRAAKPAALLRRGRDNRGPPSGVHRPPPERSCQQPCLPRRWSRSPPAAPFGLAGGLPAHCRLPPPLVPLPVRCSHLQRLPHTGAGR